MGLKFIGATDLAGFLNAFQAAQGLTDEFAFDFSGEDSSQTLPIGTYLHGLDKYVTRGRTSKAPPGPVNDPWARIGFPVLLTPVSFPNAFTEQRGPDSFEHHEPLIPGDPLHPGGQRLYAANTGPDSLIEEVTPVTSLTNSGAAAFPTLIPANGPINIFRGTGAFASPVSPGGYIGGAQLTGEQCRGRMIFEGLTDGIPGETNLVGANVYPAGLMLGKYRSATCPVPIGTGVAADCDNAISWQDLHRGGIDGRLAATPGIVHSTFPNSEAPIAGNEFSWYPAQYVPDDDATFNIPKGELHFYSSRGDVPADPLNFAQSVYIKIIDFNPFQVAPTGGEPNRVHERVRFGPTSVDFEISPMFGIGGAGDNRVDQLQLAYHPLTQRFFMVQADISFSITTPGPAPGNESFIGYWLRAVDPIGVSSPVARDVPRIDDVVEYEAFVGGALGEPAASAAVDWTLFRNSSELEVIVPVFPGFNTVANFPIDGNFALDPEGSLVVVADSVTLVEGVDYTVTLSSGRITWITDQTGATLVTASYEHRETNVLPPHGTLLSASSLSDAEGRVFTQILWPNDVDLIGTLDRLIGDLAP